MNRKLIYMYNPISGGSKKAALMKKIDTTTQQNKLDFELVATNAEGDYSSLKKRIQKEKITDIIIVGGDGTVNQLTNALQNCDVRFGIVPAGSGNGMAYAAGIPKNTDQALQIIFNGKSKKTDAFMFGDYYACMLCGLGFDATVAHKFAELPRRGLTTYVQQTVLHFFKANPYRFEIVVDNFSFFTDAYFINIANSNQFGNNVTIAPKASLNDGLLDIVIVQKMHKAKMLLEVLKQINGANKLQSYKGTMADETILYFQTPLLTIKNIQQAPLHVDGDPSKTANEFDIKIIKNCFELLQ